jgi:hypothetical protein
MVELTSGFVAGIIAAVLLVGKLGHPLMAEMSHLDNSDFETHSKAILPHCPELCSSWAA